MVGLKLFQRYSKHFKTDKVIASKSHMHLTIVYFYVMVIGTLKRSHNDTTILQNAEEKKRDTSFNVNMLAILCCIFTIFRLPSNWIQTSFVMILFILVIDIICKQIIYFVTLWSFFATTTGY